jgi:exonuclease VII small subunit
MARTRRGSAVLETARQRLSGLKSITPKPNFGPALDIDQYEREIEDLSNSLDRYNETITLLDRLQNELEDKEARVKDRSKRMLAATGAQYGPNSSEYEGVGGTRPDDYKRPTKKKPGNS